MSTIRENIRQTTTCVYSGSTGLIENSIVKIAKAPRNQSQFNLLSYE